MTDDATRSQIAAADPAFSTWLSANAGSGKTRVLIDRVARLLLAGTEPQGILCLTYTKAAASEMQNRLFRRLGEWAMLNDDALRDQLQLLGETLPASLSRARTLFARSIEAPGGLKIQTIHSFCSSILRQFPLEAGVSPQFRELDDSGQKALIDQVLDSLARAEDLSLAPITRIHADETLTGLARSIASSRARFETVLTQRDIFRHFGVPFGQTLQDVLDTAFQDGDIAFLKQAGALIATSDSSNDRKLAATLASLPDAPNSQALEIAETCLLSRDSTTPPYAARIGIQPTKAFREGPFLTHVDRFNTIMEHVEHARRARLSLEAAAKSAALHDFARAFLPAYAQAKETLGVLDFDDLIQRSGRLLTTRSLEWVLYRLDGGIQHILVDEAQDTSPDQWNVIDALAREILAGEGARADRTLFIVGDKKQSIYSFQGADAAEFDRMRAKFSTRLSDSPTLEQRELHYSFRSSAAILSTVDTVFRGEAGRGLDPAIQHRAFHESLPGRVDLWPLVPAPEKDTTPAWYDPVDRTADDDPKIVLANLLARQIEEMMQIETIPSEKGQSRPVRAGDFLILVQGRGALFDQIIRACKARNLPMAGADRLKIGGELAVRDLLALLSFLSLPEDDLSLAAALRSPLFGWSEKDLYALARGRKQDYLWAELRDRRADFLDTFHILDALRSKVDFLRPYELLELILTRYDGRRNLLARLGAEAEDGIDELLNQALTYEGDAVPSLTGFLTRAQTEEVEIKRQSDGSGNLIRVMTVHGAKGLESPIVILPDTMRPPNQNRDPILMDDGLPLWRMPKATCADALIPAREAAEQADAEERRRLLYVAMTRAEKWLIVCGAESRRSTKDGWYLDVQNGLSQLSATPLDTPTGQGWRVSHGSWPIGPGEPPETETKQVEIPEFLRQPAPVPEMRQARLAPSGLGGDKTLGGGAREEEAALRQGRQIHRLLEFLPSLKPTRETARRVLASGPDPLADGDIDAMLAEALGVIRAHPDLFTGDGLAEVDISAILPALGQRLSGTIDRLIVAPDRVTAIDFKTNAIVPDRPEAVPEGILRQMGAYLEALTLVYPGREVTLRILWTRTAETTDLPHAIVRQALDRTTTS